MCERDLQGYMWRHVKVIYLRAVSVSAQLNGLWAATLTEYGPMCKGECTESDLCSARCLRGSNIRCML